MQTDAHRGDDAEVTTSSFDSPEQVAVVSCVARGDSSIRKYQLSGDQVVRSQPEARHQRSIAASQNKAGHADSTVIADDGCQSVPAGCVVQIGNRHATRNGRFEGFHIH